MLVSWEGGSLCTSIIMLVSWEGGSLCTSIIMLVGWEGGVYLCFRDYDPT